MALIDVSREGRVLVASLQHGKANALNRVLLEELHQILNEVASSDDIGAMVLASNVPGFFSAGFDVGEVFQYDGPAMRDFFGKFIDIYEGIQRLPKGVVAAISGHTYAGGAILSVACDWRVMSKGKFGFALNEVNVGISVSPGIARMVVNLLGAGYARQMLLTGDPVDADQALRIGLVNEAVAADKVLQHAVDRAQEFANKAPATFAAIKSQILEACELASQTDREHMDGFIAEWESDQATVTRRKLLQLMSKS